MHSRIFKVQPNLNKDFELIREYDYEDNGFLDTVGDWVSDDVDLMEDYQWLSEGSKSDMYVVRFDGEIKEDADQVESFPLAYLEVDVKKAEAYIAGVLSEYAKKVVADPKFALSYEGELMIQGDKFGFYFDVDGWGYMTEFAFLNHVVDHYKEGIAIFRLEGTLDYHS